MQTKWQPLFILSETHNPKLTDALKKVCFLQNIPNRVLIFQTPVAPFNYLTFLTIYSQFV